MNKGVLELCILQDVSYGERYGYELMKHVTTAFPQVSTSTVYAIVRRLRQDGKLQLSERVEQEPGEETRRKYYSLTQKGEESLKEALNAWEAAVRGVESFGIQFYAPSDGAQPINPGKT